MNKAANANLGSETILATVRAWVDTLVVGLNLCPFAKRELVAARVRFVATDASTQEQLLTALYAELALLNADDSIETSLLVHPEVLTDFLDYNDFLDLVDMLIEDMGLDGVIQIASFHPDYQFGGTQIDDAENYTNRAPYPLLHLLREASLERAIESHPDVAAIPERNIALMNSMGTDKLKSLLKDCAK
jgi:hypothetical protein